MEQYLATINYLAGLAKQADDTSEHCTCFDDKLQNRRLAESIRDVVMRLRLRTFDVQDMLAIPTVH